MKAEEFSSSARLVSGCALPAGATDCAALPCAHLFSHSVCADWCGLDARRERESSSCYSKSSTDTLLLIGVEEVLADQCAH